ncbi:NADP-dependent oxidoreductase [Nocardioides yefusunii]|uniref:NADP-dependent oxidoreductase n=1 Tax=Nocardioides yefusunii TaxID=2500546 RepID=A0ABW1QUV5_9ACTN|nr:NADP-dependent oxidoreductase [Nocardioides yefusunii]
MAFAREVHVRSYPDAAVGPEHFEVVEVPVPTPAEGEVLVRNTWTSVDPGMRLRLRPHAPEGYFTAFELGRPMDGVITLGEVVESRAEGFAVGDTVWHPFGWRTHAVVPAGVELMNGAATLRRLDVTDVEPQWYLGPLGAMGLTAWSGLAVVDALKGGETLWVSAAAGAVGSLVAQIGVLLGHRVLASAGTDAKVAWLRDEVGVAGAFNHRTQPLAPTLRELAPEGIDVYFDNVGGDHLEAALDAMAMHGRIALCGSVSDYEGEAVGPRNIFLATAKHLTLQGFRGSLHIGVMEEMQRRLGGWLRSGELVQRETVYSGLEQAPRAMADMLAGRTVGKTLVRLA